MSPVATSVAAGNALLASLPAAELERVSRMLDERELTLAQTIATPGQPFDEILFPVTAVCSVIVETQDRRGVEAGTIGYEGVVGLPRFLGAPSSPRRTVCQIGGSTLFGAASDLAAHPDTPLADAVRRYASTFLTQAAQTAACNRLHPLEQRAARWLLMTDDRTAGAAFHLTHEFFAIMLGAHRPSVSLAAQLLQRRGLIEYARGNVRILDRRGLEAASCECYGVIRDDYAATMGMALKARREPVDSIQ
ncbi:MAG TPA: Crp/Fnr family transcriptional regulator [Candidatus Limnocylindria bacterium]